VTGRGQFIVYLTRLSPSPKKNSFLELPMGCIVRGYRELKRTLRINSRAHSVKPDSRILVAVPRGIARKAASVGGSRTRGN
jgi:hypothetical protein